MKTVIEEMAAAKAEVQMEVESLTSAKQKVSRKLVELKEEASREASLRSSLEESHATLLTRLHDLEAVIENLQSENKNNVTAAATMKADILKVKEELTSE